MKRTTIFLTATVLGSFAILFLAAPAEARGPVYRTPTFATPRFATPTFATPRFATPTFRATVVPSYSGRAWNHAPGWDWQRTYPWSAYNYGRNPYNPAWYGYGYPVYYPTPVYYPVPSVTDSTPYTAGYSPAAAEMAATLEAPHPTGAIKTPPANAALVQVKVPDAFAQVQFNGVAMSATGTSRSYVTPDLPAGQQSSYVVSATWSKNGQQVTQQKQIEVQPGATVTVDFTR